MCECVCMKLKILGWPFFTRSCVAYVPTQLNTAFPNTPVRIPAVWLWDFRLAITRRCVSLEPGTKLEKE